MMKIQRTVYKFLAVYSFLVLFTQINPLQGQEAPSLQKADSLFREQRYTQAYQRYEEVLERGLASPGMLLRMAYVQESLGNTEETLYLLNLYYRQTSDREVLRKIEKLAEQEKLRGYEYSDVEYFQGIIRQYRAYIIIGLMVLCGALFLWMLYQRSRSRNRPVWQGVVLVVLLGGLYFFTNYPLNGTRAIIARDHVYLMRGPSAGSGVVDVLRKGHRLKVLGREDVWYRVEWKDKVVYVKDTGITQV